VKKKFDFFLHFRMSLDAVKKSLCECAKCQLSRNAEIKDDGAQWEKRRQAIASARQRLDQILRAENLESVEMQGDGNCQFRAIAAYFTGDVDHLFIRRKIVEYIYKNQEKFQADIVIGLGFENVEQYCREMIVPGTWGDAITLMAYCLYQNINIVVFSEQGKSELYPQTEQEEKEENFKERPRMGLVRFNNHYEATRVIKNN
jgi:hypothetical protein